MGVPSQPPSVPPQHAAQPPPLADEEPPRFFHLAVHALVAAPLGPPAFLYAFELPDDEPEEVGNDAARALADLAFAVPNDLWSPVALRVVLQHGRAPRWWLLPGSHGALPPEELFEVLGRPALATLTIQSI